MTLRPCAALAALTAVLSSCQLNAPEPAGRWHLRAGGYLGTTVAEEPGTSLDRLSGTVAGGRVEMARSVDALDGHLELGPRVSVGARRTDGDDVRRFLPAQGTRPIEAEATDVLLDAVVRGYALRVSAPVRPFAELFVGWGYTDARLDPANGPSLSFGPQEVLTHDAGLTYGASAGLEVAVGPATTLAIAIEARESEFLTGRNAGGSTDLVGTLMLGFRW